jgi:hypothetical protein
MFCAIQDLNNESDVEQKFLIHIITAKLPNGLGYKPYDYRTKDTLSKIQIDKGDSKKQYRPDYMIFSKGMPAIVVEAKSPKEDISNALREARLYATEINAKLPPKINSCCYTLCSNGHRTIVKAWDSDEILIDLSFEDATIAGEKYAALIELLGRDKISEVITPIIDKLTHRPYYQAVRQLGGTAIRDEEIGYNDFGTKLAIDYRNVFTPESRKDRNFIARNAYVPSHRRSHYADEIDQIIRSAVINTIPGAKLIEDTSSPAEVLHALRAGKRLENEVMLLVGGRGCGKTTFIDHCREVKLPKDILDVTVWVHINLNESPSDKSILEKWLLSQLITELKRSRLDLDYDTRAVIDQIFNVEILRHKKSVLSDFAETDDFYRTSMANEIQRLTTNELLYAKAISRFFTESSKRLLVIVFDNCDKRDREEQLNNLQAARWLQSEVRCLIILPIRDITYESYKDEPPLDTYIKDLVFRIEPPPFSRVLSKRIELVLKSITTTSGAKQLSFTLSNGMTVHYPSNELGLYLASIYKSLYEHDRIIRSLLLGLSGRNLRKAMEIFLEFCKSGHIDNKEYMKIKNAKGEYQIAYHSILQVMLRRSRRYYNSDQSFLCNLFQCEPNDAFPSHFTRIGILIWLDKFRKVTGPRGLKGFHKASKCVSELSGFGFDVDRVIADIELLIKKGCIVTEHQRAELRSSDDLIKLSPSGHVHLGMAHDIFYMSACAEDTWMNDGTVINSISERLGTRKQIHLGRTVVSANAEQFGTYIAKKAKDALACAVEAAPSVGSEALKIVENYCELVTRRAHSIKQSDAWYRIEERIKVNEISRCTVTREFRDGYLLRMSQGLMAFMPKRSVPHDLQHMVRVGVVINANVRSVDSTNKKIMTSFVKILNQ